MISFELWVIMNDGTQFDQTAEFSKNILAPFFDTHIRSSWYSFSVLLLGKVVWRICVRLAELAVLDRIRFLMGLIWLATSSIYIYKDISKSFSRKMPPIIHDIKKSYAKTLTEFILRIEWWSAAAICCCRERNEMNDWQFFLSFLSFERTSLQKFLVDLSTCKLRKNMHLKKEIL